MISRVGGAGEAHGLVAGHVERHLGAAIEAEARDFVSDRAGFLAVGGGAGVASEDRGGDDEHVFRRDDVGSHSHDVGLGVSLAIADAVFRIGFESGNLHFARADRSEFIGTPFVFADFGGPNKVELSAAGAKIHSNGESFESNVAVFVGVTSFRSIRVGAIVGGEFRAELGFEVFLFEHDVGEGNLNGRVVIEAELNRGPRAAADVLFADGGVDAGVGQGFGNEGELVFIGALFFFERFNATDRA